MGGRTMNVQAKRATIGIASTAVAAGLVIGGVVSNSSAATTPPTKKVSIVSMRVGYLPKVLTIKAGTRVLWTNNDSTMAHTVVSTSGPVKFTSPGVSGLAPHKTYAFTFTKPGTYRYHCTLHFSMPSATIVVTK